MVIMFSILISSVTAERLFVSRAGESNAAKLPEIPEQLAINHHKARPEIFKATFTPQQFKSEFEVSASAFVEIAQSHDLVVRGRFMVSEAQMENALVDATTLHDRLADLGLANHQIDIIAAVGEEDPTYVISLQHR